MVRPTPLLPIASVLHSSDEDNFIQEIIHTLCSFYIKLLHRHHISIWQHTLVDCSITALTQFHVFAKVSCGISKLIVGKYGWLDVNLFKFLFELKLQITFISSALEK
ncbi:hypothetical protein KC19_9G141600 [Ceratodon purpureus]|uniref:Uncharacterized protein n=1 Tax=Ceratodon purpureus TaxID=3225 RepID=A0A8T0GUY5_CERPU|nr:hypothetical protein KC19_9G141200 [Ceratodon purpureus]KAG0562381.1 hypothetical protein KC19_9G141600 [Ceratodon purpureus]